MTAENIADEYPRPPIIYNCERCRVRAEDVDLNSVIVSPAGLAHFANEDRTQCGKDATGPRWWWPL